MSEHRCSFCGKLSPALHLTETLDALSLLICEACARSTLEAIERKKVGSRVPQPSLDFTKETAGAVLGEECRRLAAEATTLCEQLVGDILWGGLAQERVAHKIRLIQLLWLCRARLAGTMRLARASKFDAVPDLVEQANVVRHADSVEKLGDCAAARRIIEKIEEQVRLLQAMASPKHRVTIRPLGEDQGSLPAVERSKRLREILDRWRIYSDTDDAAEGFTADVSLPKLYQVSRHARDCRKEDCPGCGSGKLEPMAARTLEDLWRDVQLGAGQPPKES